ncbi:unnamed protein product [Cladocopium goreaui]|uniref:Uncharacterized protein n=1 Tax=Cladocopium goreaui TaxID=2562237 RepID=A0A9P1CVI7_9DINO|nr:unnamed protein product [Cladocopium goreaui]
MVSPGVMPVESPQQLPREGIWYTIQPACSEPTRSRGDYSAYPHLSGKAQFKQSMTPRAGVLVKILGTLSIDPQCTLCERHRGYEEHLGAEKHWKALYPTYTGENVIIEDVKDKLWNQTKIPGGYVRLNELTGEIQLAKGIHEPMMQPGQPGVAPPDMVPPVAPAPAPTPASGPWGAYTPTQPTPAPMPEPCAAAWGTQPAPTGPHPGAMGPGPMPGIRTFPAASTWSSDNFSTAGHAGQRVDLESNDSEGYARVSNPSSMSMPSMSNPLMKIAHRNLQSKSKILQDQLIRHQVKPDEFLCVVCQQPLHIAQCAAHFGSIDHLQQLMANVEAEQVIHSQAAVKLRLRHIDLSLEVIDEPWMKETWCCPLTIAKLVKTTRLSN